MTYRSKILLRICLLLMTVGLCCAAIMLSPTEFAAVLVCFIIGAGIALALDRFA